MKVYYNIDNLTCKTRSVVSVGSFDGLHRGHQVLIDTLTAKAHELQAQSVVVTFGNHPRQCITGSVKLLSTTEEKLYLLEKAGVDCVVVLPFDNTMRNLSATEFVEQILCQTLHMVHIIVGYDHRFGRDKEGDIQLLLTEGAQHGFGVTEVGQQSADGCSVSSTDVREAISRGDMAYAAKLLGHPYMVCGKWQSRALSLPESSKILPPDGIYRVNVEWDCNRATTQATIADSTICIDTTPQPTSDCDVCIYFE